MLGEIRSVRCGKSHWHRLVPEIAVPITVVAKVIIGGSPRKLLMISNTGFLPPENIAAYKDLA